MLSCTRNLFAGVLLLFKHKLSLMSPESTDEVLLKDRIRPHLDKDGELQWQGIGHKTVNLQGIKERFSTLSIDVDWKRVEKVQRFRNDIEHYYTNLSHDAMRQVLANVFLVVHRFVTAHIGADIKTLFPEDAYKVMLTELEVYNSEKSLCNGSFASVEWESGELESAIYSASCPTCGSGLIFIPHPANERESNVFSCKSCDDGFSYEDFTENAIDHYYAGQNYLAAADGADVSSIECPICSRDAYILEDQRCAICGESVEHICHICGTEIPPEELSEDVYCSWCLHVTLKDD